MKRLKIGVVGGSVGGLTTGCLLRDLGHDVTVYERSDRQLEQRGAGIGLLRATWRYLHERVGVALEDISVGTDIIRYLDRSAQVVHESNQSYLFSSWNTVYVQTLETFGRDRYQLGHELVDFNTTEDGAWGRFGNGAEFDGDLLVCADGIGSMVRDRLQPEAHHHYAGYVAWRGTIAEGDLSAELAAQLGEAITYYVYANSHILVYPIPAVTEAGQRLINFVWYRNYQAGPDLDDVLTDRLGVRRDLSIPPGLVAPSHDAEVRAHAKARLPEPIAQVVDRTEDLFLQVVYEIEVERMVFGRVILLGDAAFAARPHAAAGTAKAADDAWTLAEALAEEPDLDAALARWEPVQLALGRDLVDRTRRIGYRSQIENSWEPGDPEFVFGLHSPGD